MAKLSEEEEWESRPILEVFETEEQEGEKASFNAKNVDRDIAKSMFNLRKSLQTEDFMKIFDKRNIFIGDP
jgi:glutaredoxin-related protein